MDGVYFERASIDGPFAKTLDAGNVAYCVMVRCGALSLEVDFPATKVIVLGPGDAVAISGMTPHTFRSMDDRDAGGDSAIERRPMNEIGHPGDVELMIGVAPSEALALGSLMVGPIVVQPDAHPDLSRRLWGVVEMLEDEYADASWIDRNLVIRRLAEIMLITMSRRVFAYRPPDAGAAADRQIMQAIRAFFRAPDQAWSLAELARAAGMSRTRFAEAFKAVTGQTPGRIIARMRLTAAARRLSGAALSIEAAAEEAGYGSSAAFVRAFQRAFGETPARWRRSRSPPAAPAIDRVRSSPTVSTREEATP